MGISVNSNRYIWYPQWGYMLAAMGISGSGIGYDSCRYPSKLVSMMGISAANIERVCLENLCSKYCRRFIYTVLLSVNRLRCRCLHLVSNQCSRSMMKKEETCNNKRPLSSDDSENKIPEKYQCPLCDVPLKPFSRYPHYICGTCAEKATDKEGRALHFYNEDWTGGFGGEYRDNGEKFDSHFCYIDGQECYADEFRFGGIVIQLGRWREDERI